MKIGFVSLWMADRPLEEVLELARLAGAEAMEINGRSTVHQGLWSEPVDYADIKARFEAGGVFPTSLGGYCDFTQLTDEGLSEQVEQFVGYCQVARRMGIPIVRAFAGDVIEGHTLDELYPRLVAGFKAVTDRVKDWGLKIGIENHGRLINNGDQLCRLIGDVGSPILGMTIDTGNFVWAGHSIDETQRFFQKLIPLTVSVHVKDVVFSNGEVVFVPAGRGVLDLATLMRSLAAAGYDGPVVSEYEGEADFRVSTIESVAYLRGLRDAVS